MPLVAGRARTAPDDADLPDTDVPAAVLCMACGRMDCAGCVTSERAPIVSTPWEANDRPVWHRLRETAHLATVDGEAFFGTLPDGSVTAAFGFALSCELLAIASLALISLPVVYALVPGFVEEIAADHERRAWVAASITSAIPLLALMMVGLHMLWAASLEFGLRLSGAKARPAHCLRYALYSCGWDLVTSPFGFAAGWASVGFRGATAELRAAIRIPRFATVAYIGRARSVPERKARRALLVAAVLTGAIVLALALTLGVALVLAFT
jgi:hypothetical protein